MTLIEAYFYLLFDNFLAMLVLPIHEPFVEAVMHVFGTYNISYIFFFATLGEILAHYCNIILGKILRTVSKKPNSNKQENILSIIYTKYFYFTLLLMPIFFLNSFNSVLVGVFGKNDLRSYILPIALFLIFYRMYFYLTLG